MCLAQGPQRSDAGEARTRGPSVSSHAFYHWATALPSVTLASRYIPSALCYLSRYQSRSSMFICGRIPRNFAELTEAVPIPIVLKYQQIY